MGTLLSLALLFLVWWWWPVDECYQDQAQWQYKWTRARQIRCCARYGIGCVNNPTSPPGAVDPFNCALGYANWKAGWSMNKKNWCCERQGKGCPGSGSNNMVGAAGDGYGAGAQNGPHGAQVANAALGTR